MFDDCLRKEHVQPLRISISVFVRKTPALMVSIGKEFALDLPYICYSVFSQLW